MKKNAKLIKNLSLILVYFICQWR